MADRSTEEKALTFSDKLKLVYNHTLWTDYIKKGKIKEGTILDKTRVSQQINKSALI